MKKIILLIGLILLIGCSNQKSVEQIREEAYLSGGNVFNITITENPTELNCFFDFPSGDVLYLVEIDGKEQKINATCEYGIKMNCKYVYETDIPFDTTKIYDCKIMEE